MQKILLKIRYFERGLSKSFKVGFIFSFEPSPSLWKIYLKQNGPGTSDQLLFRLETEFRKIPLLVIFYRTKFDDII